MTKREEISTRLHLGDDIIINLRDIKDPETAKIITKHVWHGIETTTVDIDIPDIDYDIPDEPPSEQDT